MYVQTAKLIMQDKEHPNWNVRTMFGKANSIRHMGRTALISHELSHFNVDVAGLSEVRHADEDRYEEILAGFTLFWSWNPSDGNLSMVGVILRNFIAFKLEIAASSYSNRIIFMRLSLKSNQNLTLFSVYATNLLADLAVKEHFYSHLRRDLSKTPACEKVLVLLYFST